MSASDFREILIQALGRESGPLRSPRPTWPWLPLLRRTTHQGFSGRGCKYCNQIIINVTNASVIDPSLGKLLPGLLLRLLAQGRAPPLRQCGS